MKKIITPLLAMALSTIFSLYAKGQNLVPNPSFEQFDTCPSDLSQLPKAIPWFRPSIGSPDYYNACDSIIFLHEAGVPFNYSGYQQAHTGVGYAGIFTYDTYRFGWHDSTYLYDSVFLYREYIEVKLLDSLQAGKSYIVKFYISLGDSSHYATDAIGAYFSQDSILNDTGFYYFPYVPQVANQAGNIISDKINWTLISGEFIAKGGEQFITIGNFNDNEHTDTLFSSLGGSQRNSDFTGAYYYIDDISVSLYTDDGINENSIYDNLHILPNPFYDKLTLKWNNLNVLKIEVYSVLGNLVFEQSTDSSNKESDINLNNLAEGLYNIRINTNNGFCTKKIIKLNSK